MCQSLKDVLGQVDRECDRALGHATSVDGVLGIARYELTKTIRGAAEDTGELVPVQTRLNKALDMLDKLRAEIILVMNAAEVAQAAIKRAADEKSD